ncbi:MAG TPA: hypothetical protein VHQ22_05995 [Terriglobales bacterium]|jgi:hypothetical protein|nr:hypothetical protein [Terriglobales bacterium]
MSQIEYHDQAENLIWNHGLENHLREHQQDEVDAWLGRTGRIWFKEPEILVVGFSETPWEFPEGSNASQHFEFLEEVIDHSRSLVQSYGAQDDDGESEPISLTTWQRVQNFLLKQAIASVTLFNLPIPIPDISPAGEGSIDVFWQVEGRELLMNFPAVESEPITYYGQTAAGDQTTAGRTTGAEERPDLIAWLMQSTR